MSMDIVSLQGGKELGGIYVKTMSPDGSAALSGKLNVGKLLIILLLN